MPRPAVAVLLAAGLLAGCSSTVTGTGAPAAIADPRSAGPLEETLGSLDLNEAVADENARIRDIAAAPYGGWVALVGQAEEDFLSNYLVRLRATDDGPEAVQLVQIPYLEEFSRVFVTPDGTVVAAGIGYGDSGRVFELVTLAPGADTAEEHVVDPLLFGEDAHLSTFEMTLADDGEHAYVSFVVDTDDGRTVSSLATLDLGNGTVSARGDLGIDSPGEVLAWELAATDDGLLALVQVDRDEDGDDSDAVLVHYDSTLSMVGEPVELVGDDTSWTEGLTTTDDGTVIALVGVGDPLTGDPTVLVVRDDEVVDRWEVDDTTDLLSSFDVDPDGRYAYLVLQTTDHETELATLDLTSGETVAGVPLCEAGGSFGYQALDADAQTLAVAGICFEDDDASRVFLVG